MALAWNFHGACLELPWDLDGTRMGLVWGSHGTPMRLGWDFQGIFHESQHLFVENLYNVHLRVPRMQWLQEVVLKERVI